jgi:hypothetical protein
MSQCGIDNCLDRLRKDNRLGVSQTVYISFATHYVTVTIEEIACAAPLVSSLEPMLVKEPRGTLAGFLEVMTSDDGLFLSGSDCIDSQYFEDLGACARALHHRVIKILLDSRPDLLWIHAGVISLAGEAVVLAAPSGHGKSTMVAEFLARGWTYLSDEIAAIDARSATAIPFPLWPQKRVCAAGYLTQEEVVGLSKVRIELHPAAIARHNLPIRAIYFLSYLPVYQPTRLVACSPGTAVIQLLRNSLSAANSRDEEIQRLCSVVGRATTFYMYYSNAQDAARQIIVSRLASPQPIEM